MFKKFQLKTSLEREIQSRLIGESQTYTDLLGLKIDRLILYTRQTSDILIDIN